MLRVMLSAAAICLALTGGVWAQATAPNVRSQGLPPNPPGGGGCVPESVTNCPADTHNFSTPQRDTDTYHSQELAPPVQPRNSPVGATGETSNQHNQ
jgi:hypothetical protein